MPQWIKSRALLAAGIGIALVFIALNHSAYDGYFQDDELDILVWTPTIPAKIFLSRIASPFFNPDNFRPFAHIYFGLMSRKFSLNFPPWMTPVFAIHLLNGLLLFLLMRKLSIRPWCALAGAAFFTLSVSAFDAYWKPAYIFDLVCTTFCVVSILLYAYGRWILSFIAFWLAYKSKELAVMLPLVLVAYEYWFGRRKFLALTPFLIVSLSFGLQGIFLNTNKDNEYAFRFGLRSLESTIPFYSERFLMVPFSGLALFALVLVRDRRVWFGLAAMSLLIFPLLFLPRHLFDAYVYLPLACATIALSAVAARFNPVWAWIALALWMPFNARQLRHESRAKLARDDQIFTFVDTMQRWGKTHPEARTLVYQGVPTGFHQWGVSAAWNLAHRSYSLPALWFETPDAKRALDSETVVWGMWDGSQLKLSLRAPQ